jgi:hypothetical protein
MTPDYSLLPFQLNWVQLVRQEFKGYGAEWKRGDVFDWEQRGIPWRDVMSLFNRGFLMQEAPTEDNQKKVVGDGLDELGPEELKVIVDNINAKVKLFAKTEREYDTKKCKTSTITKKQRGHIRTWRNSPWADWEQA